jgi:glutamine synthetase type III
MCATLLGKLAIMSRLMEGHYFGGIPSFMQIIFPETDWNFYRH